MRTNTAHFFSTGDDDPFYSITLASTYTVKVTVSIHDLREGILSDLLSSYQDQDLMPILSALDVVQDMKTSMVNLEFGENKFRDVILFIEDYTPPSKYAVGDTVFLEYVITEVSSPQRYDLKSVASRTTAYSIREDELTKKVSENIGILDSVY